MDVSHFACKRIFERVSILPKGLAMWVGSTLMRLILIPVDRRFGIVCIVGGSSVAERV